MNYNNSINKPIIEETLLKPLQKMRDMRDGTIVKLSFNAYPDMKAESYKQMFIASSHFEILMNAMECLKSKGRIDFLSRAGMGGSDKLQKKHYLVYAIEEVLKTIKESGRSLCRTNGQTYIYNGAYWKNIDREILQAFFGNAAKEMGVPETDAKLYLFRQELLKQFEATAYLLPPEREDGVTLINFLNGTFIVDGNTQNLRPPNSKDFITYQLPFSYIPDAPAPKFMEFLNRVLPDKEKQMVLQEYLGYVFISSQKLKLEKVLLLYGSGANGKSVFIEIISAMLGKDNVSQFSLESITKPESYTRALLGTKLINLSTEISGKMDKGLFKQLASGESVEARQIYGVPFTLDNYAKLLFSTNELPKETESTEGFFRRWLIIPFDVTIPEAEQDKELSNKIISNELSGVFGWVLEGLNRLLIQKRFTDCKAVTAQIKAFRQQSDNVLMFIEENSYEQHASNYKTLQELFICYQNFCMSGGYRPCSQNTFGSRLKSSGFEVVRKAMGNIVYCHKVDRYSNVGCVDECSTELPF